MHSGCTLVIYLHAIHAYVALTAFGVARDYTRHGDEATCIFRPALQDRKVEQREVVTFDDFLAWPSRNCLGEEFSHFRQHGQHLHFVEETLRRFYVHEMTDAVGNLVERIHLEGQIHAPRRTELVDQYLRTRMTFDVLEEEHGATGHFADTVRDLCDLEDGIRRGANLFQFARTLQRCHPVTQIFVGQLFLRSENARLYGTVSALLYQAATDFWISNFRFPIANLCLDLGDCSVIFDKPLTAFGLIAGECRIQDCRCA